MIEKPQFQSKVTIPKPGNSIRRQRLLERLHGGLNVKLAAVEAGAGYGKTTLLAQFATQVDFPVYWYSLDPWDSDPLTFFEYLVWAARCRFPQFGDKSLARLAAVRDFRQESRSLVSTLLAELQEIVPDYCVFILDDYHHVDRSQEVNSLVEELVSYAPENVRVLVSSRKQLPFPTLPRLIANRQAIRLTTADLRFTPDEIQAFHQQTTGGLADEAQKEAIARASGGWAAALVLTRLGDPRMKPTSLQGQDLFDYMASEVFLQLPDDERAFLLGASALPELRAALCDRLLERRDSATALARLAKENVLISERDGAAGCYQMHSLFRSFLNQRLKADSQESFRALHIKAGALLEEEGDWNHALASYLTAGDADSAASLLEKVGGHLMAGGKWGPLASAIEALPAATLRSRPNLLVLRARALAELGNPDEALALLAEAIPLLQSGGNPVFLAKAYLTANVALRFLGRVEDALGYCQQAKEVMPNNAPASERAQLLDHTGICHALLRDMEKAEAELVEAVRLYEKDGDTFRACRGRNHLGNVYTELGRVDQAIIQYELALRGWEHLGNDVEIARVLNNLASLYHTQGEWELAMEISRQAMAKADSAGLERSQAYARVTYADALSAKGAPAEAIESYNKGLELCRRCGDTRLLAYATDGLARAFWKAGERNKARVLLDKALALVQEQGATWEMGLYSITAGNLYSDEGDHSAALSCLEKACACLGSVGAPLELARANLHLAHAYQRMGQPDHALPYLQKVAELIREVGHYLFLLNDAVAMLDLLQEAAVQNVGDGLFSALQRRVLSVLETKRRKAPSESPGGARWTQVAEYPAISAFAFGAARVLLDDQEVPAARWRSSKAKELFFYLVTQSRPLRKEEILDSLWGNASPEQAETSFKSNLFRARHATYPGCLSHRDGYYEFVPKGPARYDVGDFKSLVEKARRLPKGSNLRATYLREAVSLYRGPFLEEFYSEWCEAERHRLEAEYMRALASLAGFHAARGDFETAAQLCEQLLAVDSFDEDAAHDLIKYHVQAGNRAAAMEAYHRYESLVAKELGVAPPPRMARLYQEIRRGT